MSQMGPLTDMAAPICDVRFSPIVLQKSLNAER
jgi:hypothetical protein